MVLSRNLEELKRRNSDWHFLMIQDEGRRRHPPAFKRKKAQHVNQMNILATPEMAPPQPSPPPPL
jgi:hypothetical protein